MFLFWIIYGFMVYYLTMILLFEKKQSHHGPFPSAVKKVRHVYTVDDSPQIYEYPVTLFDRFRRLFGLYKVVDDTWIIRPERLEVWTCPICLSFWIALLGTPLFLLELSWGMAVIYSIGAAGLSSFLHSLEVFNAS